MTGQKNLFIALANSRIFHSVRVRIYRTKIFQIVFLLKIFRIPKNRRIREDTDVILMKCYSSMACPWCRQTSGSCSLRDMRTKTVLFKTKVFQLYNRYSFCTTNPFVYLNPTIVAGSSYELGRI